MVPERRRPAQMRRVDLAGLWEILLRIRLRRQKQVVQGTTERGAQIILAVYRAP
jgi:hypothetical protein